MSPTSYIVVLKSRSSIDYPRRTSGFTLVELLVAAFITFFVISASMFGLIEVMKMNQQSQSETQRRQDLNRALDFASDEIHRATLVYPDITKGIQATAPDFSLPVGSTPVLALAVPGVSKPIIYYLQRSSSPWIGPSLIRRWGPSLDADGNYVNPTQPSQWDTDASDGVGDVLVDTIESQLPNPNPICNTTWVAIPAANVRQGFFGCVSPEGRSITLYLQARVKSSSGQNKVYSISSDISVRSR